LLKCFKLEDPSEILSKYNLFSYPGSIDVKPTSIDEAYQALQNWRLYLTIISTAQDVGLERGCLCISNESFSRLVKEISPLCSSLEQFLKEPSFPKKSEYKKRAISRARETLNLIYKAVLFASPHKLKLDSDISRVITGHLDHETWCCENNIQKKTQKSPEIFLEFLLNQRLHIQCVLGWLWDCQGILEESIIVHLDPSFCISQSYLIRIMSNIKEILEDTLLTLTELEEGLPDIPITEAKEVKRQLIEIKASGVCFLQKNNFFEQLTHLHEQLEADYGLGFTVPPSIDSLISLLKEFTITALQKILQTDREQCKKESLSQQLLWLSRLFVLQYDLEMVSERSLEAMESKNSEILAMMEGKIFSNDFLEFLDLEEDALKEANLSPSGSQSENFSSGQSDIQPPTDSGKLEAKTGPESPILLQNVALKSVSKEKSKLSHHMSKTASKQKKARGQQDKAVNKSETSSQSSSSSAFPPDDLFKSRKGRHVERVLHELGFGRVRTAGSHVIWRDLRDATKQVVVPHHKEIATGTLAAIAKRITELLKNQQALPT